MALLLVILALHARAPPVPLLPPSKAQLNSVSYDNAQAESLWSRLKTEVLEVRERPVFADLADAQHYVADYFAY